MVLNLVLGRLARAIASLCGPFSAIFYNRQREDGLRAIVLSRMGPTIRRDGERIARVQIDEGKGLLLVKSFVGPVVGL